MNFYCILFWLIISFYICCAKIHFQLNRLRSLSFNHGWLPEKVGALDGLESETLRGDEANAVCDKECVKSQQFNLPGLRKLMTSRRICTMQNPRPHIWEGGGVAPRARIDDTFTRNLSLDDCEKGGRDREKCDDCDPVCIDRAKTCKSLVQDIGFYRRPTLTQIPPREIKVVEGDSVLVVCGALATPAPIFEWKINGKWHSVVTSNSSGAYHSSTFAFFASVGHRRLECRAQNDQGWTSWTISFLRVSPVTFRAPIMPQRPSPFIFRPMAELQLWQFLAIGEGSPTPRLKWSRLPREAKADHPQIRTIRNFFDVDAGLPRVTSFADVEVRSDRDVGFVVVVSNVAGFAKSCVFFENFDPPAEKPRRRAVPANVYDLILVNHFLLLYSLIGAILIGSIHLAVKLIQIWFVWERKNSSVAELDERMDRRRLTVRDLHRRLAPKKAKPQGEIESAVYGSEILSGDSKPSGFVRSEPKDQSPSIVTSGGQNVNKNQRSETIGPTSVEYSRNTKSGTGNTFVSAGTKVSNQSTKTSIRTTKTSAQNTKTSERTTKDSQNYMADTEGGATEAIKTDSLELISSWSPELRRKFGVRNFFRFFSIVCRNFYAFYLALMLFLIVAATTFYLVSDPDSPVMKQFYDAVEFGADEEQKQASKKDLTDGLFPILKLRKHYQERLASGKANQDSERLVLKFTLLTSENRKWITSQLENRLLLRGLLVEADYHAPCGKHVLVLLPVSHASNEHQSVCDAASEMIFSILEESVVSFTRFSSCSLEPTLEARKGQFCHLPNGDACGDRARCWDLIYDSCCTCSPGYAGPDCVPEDPCSSHVCLNGGRCVPNPESSRGYVCDCLATEFDGELCQKPFFVCDFHRCENFGECEPDRSDPRGYRCHCTPGQYGRDCTFTYKSTDVKPPRIEADCAKSNCLHGGTCVLDKDKNLAGYYCNCHGTGYFGDFCQFPDKKRNVKSMGTVYSASSLSVANNPYANPDQVAAVKDYAEVLKVELAKEQDQRRWDEACPRYDENFFQVYTEDLLSADLSSCELKPRNTVNMDVERLEFRADDDETGWRSGFGMPQWIGVELLDDILLQRVSFKLLASPGGDYMAPGLWALQGTNDPSPRWSEKRWTTLGIYKNRLINKHLTTRELMYSFMASKYFRPMRTGRFHIYRLALLSTAEDAPVNELVDLSLANAFSNMNIDPSKFSSERVPPAVILSALELSDNLMEMAGQPPRKVGSFKRSPDMKLPSLRESLMTNCFVEGQDSIRGKESDKPATIGISRYSHSFDHCLFHELNWPQDCDRENLTALTRPKNGAFYLMT